MSKQGVLEFIAQHNAVEIIGALAESCEACADVSPDAADGGASVQKAAWLRAARALREASQRVGIAEQESSATELSPTVAMGAEVLAQ